MTNNIIQKNLPELEHYLQKLPDLKTNILEYSFSNFAINNFKLAREGKGKANIEADLNKTPITYDKVYRNKKGAITFRESLTCNSMEQYWNNCLKENLQRDCLSSESKAILVLDLIENIMSNYSLPDNNIRNLLNLADEVFNELVEIHSEDLYPINMDAFTERPKELKNVHSIHIVNFPKDILLDFEKYQSIAKYFASRKSREPLRIKTENKEIIYE